MTCYTCKQEITESEYVSFHQHKDDEVVGISALHLACYNRINQYLHDQRKEWDEAVQAATHSSARLPGSTAETGRTPRYRL